MFYDGEPGLNAAGIVQYTTDPYISKHSKRSVFETANGVLRWSTLLHILLET